MYNNSDNTASYNVTQRLDILLLDVVICGTFKRKNCDHFAVFIKNTEEINNVWYIILVCGGNILFTYVEHVLII